MHTTSKTVLVTGGSGFIGSAFCRHCITDLGWSVINLDLLTYAAAQGTLALIENSPAYTFAKGDIGDLDQVLTLLRRHQPSAIVNFAAESHVDRSIDGPLAFIHTNVLGASVLLEAARRYLSELSPDAKAQFRFHHVSTDEVYGSLGLSDAKFTEANVYEPSSPYSASKAASDHLVRAWGLTYGIPATITNCSNNYGPYHFPEKLIPLMIIKALNGENLPVYGSGTNIRDWLHVEDHARAISLVLQHGRAGQTYNVGAHEERSNVAVVQTICDLLDERQPLNDKGSRRSLIRFVEDRPGHDLRYAIDNSKICGELGWKPLISFQQGLAQTVDWYLNNEWWWRPLMSGGYQGQRLGL